MTISEAIKVLGNALEIYGNVYVELPNGSLIAAVVPVIDDKDKSIVVVSFED